MNIIYVLICLFSCLNNDSYHISVLYCRGLRDVHDTGTSSGLYESNVSFGLPWRPRRPALVSEHATSRFLSLNACCLLWLLGCRGWLLCHCYMVAIVLLICIYFLCVCDSCDTELMITDLLNKCKMCSANDLKVVRC